jgi:hypothetical protein
MGETGCRFLRSVMEKPEGTTVPRYHFVVRAPDQTLDDQDGIHFPNHQAAREHGHRIARELREAGHQDGVLLVHDETGQIVQSIPF